jgi:hypothetical protein
LTILGISTIRKSRSLANGYFAAVFFIIVGLSALNIVIRVLSAQIDQQPGLTSSSPIVQAYMILVSVVTACMLVIFIIYGAGFYIINFGQRFYLGKKRYILFIFLIIFVTATVIGGYFLPPEYGIEFVPAVSENYSEYFKFNPVFAIYILSLTFISFLANLILLIRILPETENKLQKSKIFGFIVVIFCYFLGLTNLVIVDMQLEKIVWNYLYITTVLFLLSAILLYVSVVVKKKNDS